MSPAGTPQPPQPHRPLEHLLGRRDLTNWPTPLGRWAAGQVTRASSWSTTTWLLILELCVLGLIIGVATWGAAETYEAVSGSEGVAVLDQPALNAAKSLRSPALNQVVRWFTELGGPIAAPIVAVVAALILSAWWRTLTPVLLIGLATGGALVISLIGKAAVGRVRPAFSEAVPPFEHSASFPSGHAITTTALAGMVAYLILVRITGRWQPAIYLIAIAYIAAMGLSRVYLGHHWLSDVIMGWALGFAWLGAVITTHRLWLTWRGRVN